MERDNSDKMVMYCAIIAIIIIALCVAIGISMIDFSEDNDVAALNTTNQVATSNRNSRKNVTKNASENVVEETLGEQTSEEQITEEQELEEDVENNESELNEEEPSDDVESLETENEEETEVSTENAQNPMIELNNLMNGEKIIVSEDRMTYATNQENIKAYFQFDENDKVEGLYAEMICENESMAQSVAWQFRSSLSEESVVIDGNTVIVKWPINDAMKEFTKDEMIQNASASYVIEYE